MNFAVFKLGVNSHSSYKLELELARRLGFGLKSLFTCALHYSWTISLAFSFNYCFDHTRVVFLCGNNKHINRQLQIYSLPLKKTTVVWSKRLVKTQDSCKHSNSDVFSVIYCCGARSVVCSTTCNFRHLDPYGHGVCMGTCEGVGQ